MGWFTQLCRNTGLMIHHAAKPVTSNNKTIISRETQEQQVSETTTLRRTTIEEIEVRSDGTDKNT